MKTLIKKCKYCGNKFEAALSDHKRGRALYCSRACSGKGTIPKHITKKIPNVFCAHCSKKFYKTKSKQLNSKSGLFFCSRKCKDAAQRIGGMVQIQPPHYGTGDGRYSYRTNAFKKLLHRCAVCHGTVYVELYPVHHIDLNRTNNKINNLLIVCHGCHALIHAYKRKWISIDDPVELHLLNNLPKLNLLGRSN